MTEEGKRAAKLLALLGGLLLLFSWERLEPMVKPLTEGLCLALFLDPLCRLAERRVFPWAGRKKRLLAVWTALLLALGGMAALFWRAGPKLAQSFEQALAALPALGERLTALSGWLSGCTGGQLRLEASELPGEVLGGLLPSLTVLTSALTGSAASLLLGGIFGVWMLLKKQTIFSLARKFAHFAKDEGALTEAGSSLCRSFSAFVRGQLTEAVILGSGCFLGMLLFGKPFAGLISLMIGVTALIPVAGALAGGAFGALLLFSQSPADGMWFLIFIVLLQQLENNLIYPKVMGRSVGLPAALVLAAVLAGGALYGIPGMLLSVPASSFLWQNVIGYRRSPSVLGRTEGPDQS